MTRILQVGDEVSGQLSLTAKGLKELGHTVATVAPLHPFGYSKPDLIVPLPRWRYLRDIIKIWRLTAGRYDIYHYHFANSIFGFYFFYLDAFLERRRGSCLIVEFWGDDIRLPSLERKRNPYYIPYPGVSELTNRLRLKVWSRLTREHAIVADIAMASYARQAFRFVHFLRQRVDVSALQPSFPSRDRKIPLIVHAPSDKRIKGTMVIRETVKRLWEKGYQFEYIEVSGKSYRDVLEITRKADLVVDQIRLGTHWVYAVEAMVLGKPVICYILPDYRHFYPQDLPLINASPDDIEEVLAYWIISPKERHDRGQASRAYVEKYHDYRVVAKSLVSIYSEICR